MSPAGPRARLSTLIFHRVLPAADPVFPGEVHAHRFDQMLGWIRQWFNVLPLDQAVLRLNDGTLPARAATITFDDGYADNATVATPILQRHGLPATFFIATGFLDGGRMWNDTVIEAVRHCRGETLDLQDLGLQPDGPPGLWGIGTPDQKRHAIEGILQKIKYLPVAERQRLTERIAAAAGVVPASDLMMTSHQVRGMRHAGMQIGAHTVSHPILAKLDARGVAEEVSASKGFLEDLLQERIGLFAYPNGKLSADYVPETVEIVRQLGFDAAVTTNWGAARHGGNLFELPRFTPWDAGKLRFGMRLAKNLL